MSAEKAAVIFLGISLFAASSGATSAFLVRTPQPVDNVITAGSVDVELTEPAWDPEQAQALKPGSVVPKNPTVINTGKNNAWIFLRLSVPVRHIILVDPQSRRKMEPADTELFSFTVNDMWEQIARTEEDGAVSYVYGYRNIVEPQGKTEALFEEVALVNYLEGQLTSDETLEMPIETLAIQDHVCPEGASLSEIYDVCLQEF